jgi:branched-chain amino acid transport system ATP-binding protein
MPKLAVERLKVTYGPIVGTDGIGFTLEAGETLALVGANGAGKSSTLKAILGMASYAEGRITLDGADLKGLKASQVVRLGVGYSPEGRRVFPQLSVLDNLKVGGISRDSGEIPERLERIYGYFPRLKERAGQRAGSLSGGEQQMLAILQDIQASEGLAVLLAEQNANWALSLAHRAVILDLGRVSMTGDAAQLLNDPAVRKAYLGI